MKVILLVVVQRPVFTNISWPPWVRFSPRGELGPRGELCPLGRLFTPSFTPRGEQYLIFKDEQSGDNFNPRGQSSPLGANFIPWGKISPLGLKSKTGLATSVPSSLGYPRNRRLYSRLVGSRQQKHRRIHLRVARFSC
jgi:hypothetical protein